MNNIDDVLLSLIQAKENIVHNQKVSMSEDTYNNLVNGLDNLITDYTINNQMTSKEILDCALSLYGSNNKSFLDKLKNLRPKKIIGNFKKRIDEYNKKKELKNKYADEIVLMVKDKLRRSIEDEEKAKKQPTKNEDMKKDKSINSNINLVNNGIINSNSKDISHTLDDKNKIPIYDKEIGSVIDTMKSGTFIYQDKDNFVVYRESDNKNKDLGITSQVEFSSLNQAIVYAIDDKLSITDVKDNFDNFKNDYGNLANYVKDKRGLDHNYNNINIVNNINKELKNKTL